MPLIFGTDRAAPSPAAPGPGESNSSKKKKQLTFKFYVQEHGHIERAQALKDQVGWVAASVLYICKQLPPFEMDNTGPETLQRKILALDLDETLICKGHPSEALMYYEQLSGKVKVNEGSLVPPAWWITYENGLEECIKRRPYAIQFLKKMAKIFDVVLFTASTKERTDKIVPMVLETEGKIFSKILCREDCTIRTLDGLHAKDLSRLSQNLGDVILVDNSMEAFLHHFRNGVPVVTWTGSLRDRELKDLIPPLRYLSKVANVRTEIPRMSRFHREVYRALSQDPEKYAGVFAQLNLPAEVEQVIRGENWFNDPLPDAASLVSVPPS